VLTLLTGRNEKEEAQNLLYQALTEQLKYQGRQTIGYQGGGGDYPLYSNRPGELYYAYSAPHDEHAIRRHWNSFGIYRPSESFGIVVEINIPTEQNTAQVAGFFARDPSTGTLVIMHSGRIGGGRPGIGKDAFLAWSGAEIMKAENEGEERTGIVVGDVESPNLIEQITHFVRTVDDFKRAVTSGELDNDKFRNKVEQVARYRREFTGRKSGQRRSYFTYVTHHGAVVDKLHRDRSGRIKADESIGNSALIDLYVTTSGGMSEIYEVKCAVDRQTIYAAVGQLIVHSQGALNQVKRTLVIPDGEAVAQDIETSLRSLGIDVLHFRLRRDRGQYEVEFCF
jgi:hypothetical protein